MTTPDRPGLSGWLRGLLAVVHGTAGLLTGAVFFIHGCRLGNKAFEGLMPFVLMIACGTTPFLFEKYRWALLAAAAVLTLGVAFSFIYMKGIHPSANPSRPRESCRGSSPLPIRLSFMRLCPFPRGRVLARVAGERTSRDGRLRVLRASVVCPRCPCDSRPSPCATAPSERPA